jgi:hypothetical protein
MSIEIADKAGVLGQLWIDFREDEDFSEFMNYNDMGLPMSYMLASGLIKELTPLGEQYINESFDMFINLIEVTENEITDVLPEIDLGAILMFGYNKKQDKKKEDEVFKEEEEED